MSNMHTHLDAARKAELAQDQAEHPRRAHPVQADDPVLRALSAAEAAFSRYAAHHLRQAGKPGEDAAKRRQQAAENADLAQTMRDGIVANYARSYQVPQGWKLAPCEPTREMLDKARENLVRDGQIDPMLKSAYAAMLAATPKLVTAQAQHPDDAAVDRFADAMKAKLAAARSKGRGGWDDPAQCSVEHLAHLLVKHVSKGDPVDVANFSMMLHQRGAEHEVLAQAQAERKLTADARVANATFRKGIPERMVIDAAIRSAALHAEMEALTPEQMVEQERTRRAVWDMIHGPLSATPSPDGCGCCGDACKGRGSCRHADENPEPPTSEFKVETYRPPGLGGFSTVGEVGAKVTHIPTGLSEQCHDHRSPHRNANEAHEKLKERLARIEKFEGGAA